MDLARRMKYSGQKGNIVKTNNLIDINFDINVLSLFCSFVISENSGVKTSNLIALRNLIEMLNLELYRNDIEKMKRINFIKKGLECRILRKINNPILIIKYINGSIIDDDLISIAELSLLSNDELQWINETVSESLKFSFICNDIDRIMEVTSRFKASDYLSRAAIVKEIEAIITEVMTKFRRVRVQSETEMTFSLREGKFEEAISDIHQRLSSPNRRLIIGMQGVNELLGGGFECTRTYVFVGNTGSRKSVTLLNFADQIKKYNKGFKPKDPTKIPVVLYLTMENRVDETVQRYFEMAVGKGDLTNYTPEQVAHMLRTEGELYLTDESPIDILIKFVPDKSVDTSYLYTLVEDLEDEGYEVICLIQDHLKKIRSCFPQKDLRLELGEVLSEFKTFASIKDIPVITNTHLNRDGAKTIDEGAKANKYDLMRQVGRANIGESYLIMDNTDFCCMIGPEYDVNGNLYMCFRRTKIRGKATLREYLAYPFMNADSIKLVEDFYSPIPIFKETLKPSPQESNLYNTGINTNDRIKNVIDIDKALNTKHIEDLDDINIFNTNARYSSNIILYEDLQQNQEQEIINPIQPVRNTPFTYRNRNVV